MRSPAPHASLLRALTEPLGFRAAVLWAAGEAQDEPVCLAVWEYEPDRWEKLRPGTVLAPDDGPAARAWAADTLVTTSDALAFTIRAHGERLAVLQLDGPGTHALDDTLRAALDLVAERIGLVLEGERLARERERLLVRERAVHALAEAETRRAELLGELARSISGALDLDVILQTVTEGARELCRSDLSAIALRENETGEMVFRYRAGERRSGGVRLVVLPGRGAGGLALETGRPVRSDDAVNDPRFAGDEGYLAAVRREEIVTLLVVPIALGARIEGLLYVDNRSARPFTDHEEAVLRQLADHAAIAIRNVHLLAGAQRAREEAERANRIKDEFLATLSHELRTPLNAVLGWAVTLRTTRIDAATQARALEAIERNARTQGQLIEDLLDISRIVTGKLRLDLRPVEPVDVVEAALDAVRPSARSRGVELTTTLDPRAGPVHGDPDRLQQVISNLLTNAIKFTDRGGRIDVGLVRDEDQVEIRVADTGQGIAPDLLPHIFDRFRQAEGAGARAKGGLGIGLALVRHLTELHGGTVTAESDGEGRGATFRVRLPVLTRERSGSLRGLAGGPHPSLEGLRVLLVEDDPDSLELFTGILTLGGATVRGAPRVAAAFEILAGWVPDVIVSDIEMPEADGYALVRRLRALPVEQGGTVPAVAITAHGSLQDRLAALAAGFQMHVPKPVEPAELIAVVGNLARLPRPG